MLRSASNGGAAECGKWSTDELIDPDIHRQIVDEPADRVT